LANNLAGDPLILDTLHATNVVVQGGVYIHAIHYVGATTAGHAAELQVKSSARPFWRASATGNGADVYTLLQIVTPGDLILPTLGSGIVHVYLGPER